MTKTAQQSPQGARQASLRPLISRGLKVRHFCWLPTMTPRMSWLATKERLHLKQSRSSNKTETLMIWAISVTKSVSKERWVSVHLV